MEYKTYESIGPGTAGIAQRISSVEEDGMESLKELYLLKTNKITACGQNQY